MATIPIRLSTDPTETAGLRRATDFDPVQAQDWAWAARVGLAIGYEDRGLMTILTAFAMAIADRRENVALSRGTEARIRKFMADPRLAAV